MSPGDAAPAPARPPAAAPLLDAVAWAGEVALLLGRTAAALPTLDRRELRRSLAHFGYEALPLALGAAVLVGATVVLQAGVYAERFGIRLYTGWAAGYALLWEFGPVLLGLLCAARLGARNAAELSLLATRGQLESLRAISLDAHRLVIAPRVVAVALGTAAVAAVAYPVGIGVEIVAARATLGLPARVFLESFQQMIRWQDAAGGAVKTLAFGVAIAAVSTVCGLRAGPGARGIGRAAARSVFLNCLVLFVLDLGLTLGLQAVWA